MMAVRTVENALGEYCERCPCLGDCTIAKSQRALKECSFVKRQFVNKRTVKEF